MKGFRQYKYDILYYISNPASTISAFGTPRNR